MSIPGGTLLHLKPVYYKATNDFVEHIWLPPTFARIYTMDLRM